MLSALVACACRCTTWSRALARSSCDADGMRIPHGCARVMASARFTRSTLDAACTCSVNRELSLACAARAARATRCSPRRTPRTPHTTLPPARRVCVAATWCSLATLSTSRARTTRTSSARPTTSRPRCARRHPPPPSRTGSAAASRVLLLRRVRVLLLRRRDPRRRAHITPRTLVRARRITLARALRCADTRGWARSRCAERDHRAHQAQVAPPPSAREPAT